MEPWQQALQENQPEAGGGVWRDWLRKGLPPVQDNEGIKDLRGGDGGSEEFGVSHHGSPQI